MPQDWYPTSRDARAAWHANFAAQLPALAAKYNISAAVLATVAADNSWMQYWTQFRTDADAMAQALTRYFNTISGRDSAAPPPEPVVWQLTGAPPAEVTPGIEERVREIARQVKGDMVYSQVDGDLLGIVSGDVPPPVVPVPPVFELRTLAAFQLEATFRKKGNSAVKFEYRHIGGGWLSAGVLNDSPEASRSHPQLRTPPNRSRSAPFFSRATRKSAASPTQNRRSSHCSSCQ